MRLGCVVFFFKTLNLIKMKHIDFDLCSKNKEVIILLKQKMNLEKKIKSLDRLALIMLETQLL